MKLRAAIVFALSYASFVAAQAPAPTCERPEHFVWTASELKGPVKVVRTYETWFAVSQKTGRLEKQPRRLESDIKFEPGEPLGGTGFGTSAGDETTVRYVCGDNGKAIEEIVTTRVHPEHFRPERYDVYVTTKRTYRYDARGNKIEEKHFYPNGSLYGTWFFTYDPNDRLIKETRMDRLGRLQDQDFYEYHADGRPLNHVSFTNSCITRAGDFCKGYISSGDGFFYYATKSQFQYDSQGNWIKQTDWHMEGEVKKPKWVLTTIFDREITYYSNIKQ